MVSQASWLLLLGLVGFTFTRDLTKLKDTAPHQESYVDQCTPVPTWSVNGERVVNLVGENITVIALLNYTRLFGRQQAGMLTVLQNRFYQAGFTSINFLVVDSMVGKENNQSLRIESPNFPVIKEKPGEPVRDVLGVGNDQVLVLDRCGRIAYQVITPFSKLTHPYVKAAILSTYTDNPCGMCNQTEKVTHLDYNQEDDSTPINASDSPHTADETSHNVSTTVTGKTHEESQIFRILGKNTIQVTQKKAGQSFALNFDTDASERSSNLSALETQPESQGNTTSAEIETASSMSKKLTLSTKPIQGWGADGGKPLLEHHHEQNKIIKEGNTTRQARNLDEPSKNWDWSQSYNPSVGKIGASDERNVQSVEVVRQVSRRSQKQRNKSRSKHMGIIEHVTIDTTDPEAQSSRNRMFQAHKLILVNSIVQESSGDSGSRDISENSMEELVNQTQKLFDWYQKQTENGTSSEENYERSNILKFKIIEHYSKLLPWLSYKLTPQV